MGERLSFRQTLLLILAAYYNLSFKEIGARCGMTEKNVSHHLKRRRRSEMRDEIFGRLLSAFQCQPAAVSAVAACHESLEALATEDLTEEERAEIEAAARVNARLTREALTEAARLSRAVSVVGYPMSHELAAARLRADELFARLEEISPEERMAVVCVADEYQTWALCERVCHASYREATRNVEDAAAWARLAREIAELVRGPEPWCRRVKGFAGGFRANVALIAGELKAADAEFAEASRLWSSGSDPLGVLDPGRMFDVEVSLSRDQDEIWPPFP